MASGQAWAPTAVDGETTAPGKDEGEETSRTGEVLDRYALLDKLGKGGMGVVYRAYDPKLQREVALKIVLRQDPVARARIVREARAMAQLRHPNVVSVYDVVETEAGPVLVMPLLRGGNLRKELSRRPKTWRETIQIFVRAGRGLEAAHARGLIHRDFKPDNVLLADDGEVLVTDFGLAQSSRPGERRNTKTVGGGRDQPGAVMGTNYYMAPEQHQGGEVGAAADQFGFCASLWEALHGDPPFRSESAEGYLDAKRAGPPTWSASDVPRRIARAVERGLAFDPQDRWPNIGELLEELDLRSSKRAWVIGGAAVALGLVGAVWAAAVQSEDTAPVCPDPQTTLDATWNEKAEEHLRSSVMDSGLPYAEASADAAIEGINAYAQQWRDAFDSSCRATRVEHIQSEDLLDRSMACLEQGRVGLDSVIEELELGETKTLLRQDRVLDTLVDPQRCTDPRRLMGDDIYSPEASQAYRQVFAQQAAVRAKQAARRFEEADESAASLLEQLGEDVDPDVEWAILNLRGSTLTDVRKYDAASSVLQRALTIAESLGDAEKVLETTLSLVWLSVHSKPGDEDVRTLLASARGLADRIGEPDAWQSYAHAAIRAYDELGEFDTARELSREVLQRARSRHPEGSIVVARAKYRVAASSNDPRQAIRLLHEVENVYLDFYGPNHPSVGWIQNDQASNHASMGEDHRALEYQQQALETWRAAYPDGHFTIGGALSNMSGTYRSLGETDAAIEVATEALAVYAELGLQDSQYAAMAHNNRANAYAEAGDDAAAVSDLERALAIRLELFPEGHVSPTKAKLRLGAKLVELDGAADRDRGIELVREGWASLDRIDAELGLRHEAALEMARALWAYGPTDELPTEELRTRVTELCRWAHDVASAMGDTDRAHRTVEFYASTRVE